LYAIRHTRIDDVRREAVQADRYLARMGERAWENRPLLGLMLTVKELTAVEGLPHSRGGDEPAEVARQDAPVYGGCARPGPVSWAPPRHRWAVGAERD
jgi:Asp-tRNA(Asn)/Glu-tRNA(Gln) amidotransferase A subunit family amidase